MATWARVSVLAAVSCLAAGCSDDDLPKFSSLDRLRVLTLVANPPEADPGTAGIVLTPWVSDAKGGGRALTYAAEGCLDPGVSFGAAPTCEGQPTRAILAGGTVTGLAAPHYTGAADAIAVTLPADAIAFAGRGANDRHNGVAYLVTYLVQAADGASHRAFKRVLISAPAKTQKNQNPAFVDILADGASLASLPGGASRLSAQVGAGSAEHYAEQSAAGAAARIEDLTVSWFVSGGDLLYDRTEADQATRWAPPGVGPALVVGVLRDDRGGVAVVAKSL